MTTTIALAAFAGSIVLLIFASILAQKKSAQIQSLQAELAGVKDELGAKGNAPAESADIQGLQAELVRMKDELDAKELALTTLEQTFEEQVDEIVTSSIQKINHAEEAKEEAIKAAQDNYEAAAEAHGIIREKDAIIKELQKNS